MALEKLILRKSPLVIVLAQVRFSTVLKIESLIPDIQEALRKDYPHYEEGFVHEIQFNPNLGNTPPDVRTSKRWTFVTLDQKQCITITNNSVALETSDYDIFKTFTEQIRRPLEIVEYKIDSTVSERIGLRYVNLIQKGELSSSELYLKPGLRGLDQKFPSSGTTINSSVSQTITPCGALFLRAVQINDGNFVPPELAGTKLKISSNISSTEKVTVLDIDHNGELKIPFKTKHLLENLSKLHEYTDLAFRAAVTEEAIELWK